MNLRLCVAFAAFISNYSIAQEIPKEKFLTLFEATATGVICGNKSYLIRCYGIAPGICFERTSLIAKACSHEKTNPLPDILDSTTTVDLGKSIGACIEDGVRKEFKLPPNDQQCEK
jgi:hypothetical protein